MIIIDIMLFVTLSYIKDTPLKNTPHLLLSVSVIYVAY